MHGNLATMQIILKKCNMVFKYVVDAHCSMFLIFILNPEVLRIFLC